MTLEEQLTEAETAYHRLMTGQQASVIIDQNGERVEFQNANASKLATYIQSLKVRLGKSVSSGLRPYF